jgi:hypothetical protein
MRRRSTVATAALIAALALAGLPGPAGSRQAAAIRDLQPAAFTSVIIPADAPALRAWGGSDDATAASPAPTPEVAYVEAGMAPVAPVTRPVVAQPSATRGQAWKDPKQVLKGSASFYDNGTTAMRLPRGTLVRICGDGGCIVRTVTDYGPVNRNGRIVDLYRPDFFRVCGCASWSGTAKVTVSVY